MAENGIRLGIDQEGGGGGVNVSNGHHHDHEHGNEKSTTSRLSEAAQKYMQELLVERAKLENNCPLAVKLIDEALERIQLNGKLPTREQYADVYQQRTIKLTQKVHVPIKDRKFNYVGKLLGPKGNSLRRLQEETQCKIVILGRFSMKDRVREEELRNSAELKYAHLNLPLHVEVSTIAPPAEAYARIAYALAELRRYLIPDKHDDIRQEQLRELMEDPEAAKKITIRQQHQSQNAGSCSNNNSCLSGDGNNSYRVNNSSNYKNKYQPQSQHFHHNDDIVYYRSYNTFHQPKPYVTGNQRANPMHSTVPPQATIVGPSPAGMTVGSVANYSGRGPGLIPNSPATGTVVGSINPNIRYRTSQLLPYQFSKK